APEQRFVISKRRRAALQGVPDRVGSQHPGHHGQPRPRGEDRIDERSGVAYQQPAIACEALGCVGVISGTLIIAQPFALGRPFANHWIELETAFELLGWSLAVFLEMSR